MSDEWPHLYGPAPGEAGAALILLHGRGATAEGMLPLAQAVAGAGTSVLAPRARHGTWYPARFLAPRQENEPWLTAGLALVADLVERLERAGTGRDRIVLSGFSQGACLALEYVARNPASYGGCVAFAGALIGPDPATGGYEGDLGGTPVHLAVGDRDAHVPPDYVVRSARVLETMRARVSTRIHPGMGHGLHPADAEVLSALLEGIHA